MSASLEPLKPLRPVAPNDRGLKPLQPLPSLKPGQNHKVAPLLGPLRGADVQRADRELNEEERRAQKRQRRKDKKAATQASGATSGGAGTGRSDRSDRSDKHRGSRKGGPPPTHAEALARKEAAAVKAAARQAKEAEDARYKKQQVSINTPLAPLSHAV